MDDHNMYKFKMVSVEGVDSTKAVPIALFDKHGKSIDSVKDVIRFGIDVDMLNGWGSYNAIIYRQGGRAYLAGSCVAPDAGDVVEAFNIPSGFKPFLYEPTGPGDGFVNFEIPVVVQGVGGGAGQIYINPNGGPASIRLLDPPDPIPPGLVVRLGGVSWPLASP